MIARSKSRRGYRRAIRWSAISRTEGHVALFAPDFVASRRVRVNGRGVIKDGAIFITTDEVYGNCRRYLQERIFVGTGETPATERAAERAAPRYRRRSKSRFPAPTHSSSRPTIPSAAPTFRTRAAIPASCAILDARRIAFPDYNGNSMFNTLGNLTDNPHAGLLFIDFDTGATLQLTGRASIDWSPERVRTFPGAERVIDFALEQIIDNPAGFPLIAKFRQFSRNNPKL